MFKVLHPEACIVECVFGNLIELGTRSESYKTSLTGYLRGDGQHQIAAEIDRLSFPSFAQWRFGKLEACSESVGKMCELVSETLTFELFNGCRDVSEWKRVMSVMQRSEWRHRLQLVAEVSKSLGQLRRWGTGCRCHEQELTNRPGVPIVCSMKGLASIIVIAVHCPA